MFNDTNLDFQLISHNSLRCSHAFALMVLEYDNPFR